MGAGSERAWAKARVDTAPHTELIPQFVRRAAGRGRVRVGPSRGLLLEGHVSAGRGMVGVVEEGTVGGERQHQGPDRSQ